MPTTLRIAAAAILVASAGRAGGLDRLRCTPDEAQTAWGATAVAKGSWAELHSQYRRYGSATHCARTALSDGWATAVTNLLGRRWGELPALAALTRRDPRFLDFVLKHIDAATDYQAVELIASNAKRCPGAQSGLCTRIREVAEAELNPPSSFHSTGGIGDDVCGLMLRIEATVTDTNGAPVEGAELWEMDRIRPYPPTARAWRYGSTDAQGHLSELDCYMARGRYMFWRPEDEPLRMEFFVLRSGFGVERVSVSPPLEEVLAAGSLVTTKPGQFTAGYNSVPEWRGRAYTVKIPVVLHATTE